MGWEGARSPPGDRWRSCSFNWASDFPPAKWAGGVGFPWGKHESSGRNADSWTTPRRSD